jgi:hypothetical protein
MTQTEALKLALEALETLMIERGSIYEKAITAIKAALEANEFNPDWDTQAVLVEEIQRMAKRIEELEAKGEPWEKFCDSNCVWTDHHPDCKLAQRKWVGLTDAEVDQAFTELTLRKIYQAIEAKLKEKNT